MAFFENGKLVDYAARIIAPGRWVRERLWNLEQILVRLVQEKRPGLIALEKSGFSHQTQNALQTLAYYKVLAVARRSRIPVYDYASSTVRATIAGRGHASGADIVKILLGNYPELRVFAVTVPRWRQRHSASLFAAVAVGLTHLKKHQTHG